MQPLSGNQRPDLQTSLMNMSLVLRLPCEMHLSRSSSNGHLFLEMLQNLHVLLTFDKVHNPLRLPRETTSERPKVFREWCVLHLLASKCASRQNGVHFLDISTSKRGPNVRCFLLFHLQVCFAPQRRALFRHLNFKKCCILTSKCASRHNGVHFNRFFNSSTSKNARSPSVFNTLDFEMCFAPQRRSLFRHLNFHKCSKRGVFLAF